MEIKDIIRDLILDINFDVRVWDTSPDSLLEKYLENVILQIKGRK